MVRKAREKLISSSLNENKFPEATFNSRHTIFFGGSFPAYIQLQSQSPYRYVQQRGQCVLSG
jgi:hypothetical protein